MAKVKFVLQKVADETSKGGLHRSLGIPQGKKIPKAKIVWAANQPGKLGKQGRLAETYAKYRP